MRPASPSNARPVAERPLGLDVHERVLTRNLLVVAAEIPAHAECLGRFLTLGKQLRARLVVLSASVLVSPPPAQALRLATAIELIHAGALCHDDIVDRSHVRRGEPSMLAALGARGAALAGLFLLAKGAALLAIEPAPVRKAIAEALAEVARGQTEELADLFIGAVTPEAYLARARAKTGVLYGLAARLGAIAGALPNAMQDRLVEFATETGLGFQLADDLRDFVGGDAIGREAGTDLRQGVYTLPVLLTLSGRHAGGDDLRASLAQPRSYEVMDRCITLLHRNGAFAETRRAAHDAVERGARSLRALPPTAAVRQLAELSTEMLGARVLETRPAHGPTTPLRAAAHDRRDRRATALPVGLMADEHRRWSAVARTAVSPAAGFADALSRLASSVDGSPDDAFRIALVDLLVADFFAVLAELPAAAAMADAHGLASRLREHLAACEP